MTVVPPERTTLERHLMTLSAIKLLGGDKIYVTPGAVVKVLEAAAADGLWPVPDPTQSGSNYFRRRTPYNGGTRQHMEQMAWKKPPWLTPGTWRNDKPSTSSGLFTVAPGAPRVAALPGHYARLATEFDHERPEPDSEAGEVSKRCVICRRQFKSPRWTCGDPTCGELLELPRELMARRSELESEGLVAEFDVDLRSQSRFVEVATGRGRWRTHARKWETWEQLLARACG